jgi:hypothetical protein
MFVVVKGLAYNLWFAALGNVDYRGTILFEYAHNSCRSNLNGHMPRFALHFMIQVCSCFGGQTCHTFACNISPDQQSDNYHVTFGKIDLFLERAGQRSVTQHLSRANSQLHFGVVLGATAALVGFVLEQPFAAPNK